MGPGSWTAAAILSVTEDVFLAAGAAYELYTATYTLGADEGLAPIDFCEAGDPVIAIALGTPEDEVIFPTLGDGTIGICPGLTRGDADGDLDFVALLDAIFVLAYGFLDGPEPPCLDAADADDDGTVTALIDGIYMLAYAFVGGPAPPFPGPDGCAVDPTADALDCAVAAVCE